MNGFDIADLPAPEELLDDVPAPEELLSASDLPGLPETPAATAPAPLAANQQPVEDRGFLYGAKEELGTLADVGKQAVLHPFDTIRAVDEGILGAAKYLFNSSPEQKKADLSKMIHGMTDRPGETLGALAVDAVPAVLTGGVGGAATRALSGAAKLGKGATGALTVGAGAVGGAAAGAGSIGARAAAKGEELDESEAGMAALLGGAGGALGGSIAAPKGSVLGKHSLVAAGVKKVAEQFPELTAAVRDPLNYFESRALAGDAVSRTAHRVLTRLSHAQDKIKNDTAASVEPVIKEVESLGGTDKDALLSALRATDEKWYEAVRKGESKTDLSYGKQALRSTFGLSDEGVAAYYRVLDAIHDVDEAALKALKKRLGRKSASADLPTPVYGRIPHKWDGRYRVWYKDEGDEFPTVRAFDSESRAREFMQNLDTHYAHLLDTKKYVGVDLDELLSKIDVRKIKTGEDLERALQDLNLRSRSNLEAMVAPRKGALGYVSLRSLDDLLAALRAHANVVHSARHTDELVSEARSLHDYLRHTGRLEEAAVLASAVDRAVGAVRPHPLARAAKSTLFHARLGISNRVIGLMNLVTNTMLTPAFIAWETGKAVRLVDWNLARLEGLDGPVPNGDTVGLAKAMLYTAQAIPAGLPPRVRKVLGLTRTPVGERIKRNEAGGAVAAADAIALSDTALDSRISTFVTGTTDERGKVAVSVARTKAKLARLNTWIVRHSESASSRIVGAAFRRAGEDIGLFGPELDLFVHKAVRATVGDYNRGMRALVLEGNGTLLDAVTVALTFQTYIWQKAVQLARMTKENPKAFVAAIAPIVAIAGAEGVPVVVPVIEAAVEAADPDGSLTRAWQDFKLEHEGLFRGALAANAPVDPSGRFALGLPLGALSEYGLNPLGLYVVFARTYNATREGGPLAGLQQLGAGDALRSYGALEALIKGPDEQGLYTYRPPAKGTYRKSDKVTGTEALATLMTGIDPATTARHDRQTTADRRALDVRRMTKQELREAFTREYVEANGQMPLSRMDEFAAALAAGDPSMRGARLRKAIRKWIDSAERHNQRYAPVASKYERDLVRGLQ